MTRTSRLRDQSKLPCHHPLAHPQPIHLSVHSLRATTQIPIFHPSTNLHLINPPIYISSLKHSFSKLEPRIFTADGLRSSRFNTQSLRPFSNTFNATHSFSDNPASYTVAVAKQLWSSTTSNSKANMGEEKVRTSGETQRAEPSLPTTTQDVEKSQPPKPSLHPAVYVM